MNRNEQGDFYVPRFEIKIAGVNLPLDVLRDVEQVTYKDNVKELDSFELTVNNWDADAQDFKYVGAETADSLAKNPLHLLFNPCRHNVDVFMGYGENLSLMVTGNFTTLEPNFSGGAPDVERAGPERVCTAPQKTILLRMGGTKRPARSPRASRPCPTRAIARRSGFRCRWRSTPTRSRKRKRSPISRKTTSTTSIFCWRSRGVSAT